MAVTRVTHTGAGYSAIDYALNSNPHVPDKYVSGRVLTASGVNCTVHGCRQQMNAVWRRYGINRLTKRRRRQVQRLIQSFDPHQLDYRNPADVAEANAIGRKLASKLYPSRQSIVVTQADNAHHVLHNHVLTNMLDFRTGRSMTSRQTSWSYVQRASDDVILNFGLNPEARKRMAFTANGRKPEARTHRTDAEYHIKAGGRYSWVDDIRKRIIWAKNKAISWPSFISLCRQVGVTCDPFRHYKGQIRQLADGRPAFKKRISFRLTGSNGRQHRIRDRKLGLAFSRQSLERAFFFENPARINAKRKKREIAKGRHISAWLDRREHLILPARKPEDHQPTNHTSARPAVQPKPVESQQERQMTQWYSMPASARRRMRADMARQGVQLDRDGQPVRKHEKTKPAPERPVPNLLNKVPDVIDINLDNTPAERRKRHARKRQNLLQRQRRRRIAEIKSATKKSSSILDRAKRQLKKPARVVIGGIRRSAKRIRRSAERIREIIARIIPPRTPPAGTDGNGAGPDTSDQLPMEPSDDDDGLNL